MTGQHAVVSRVGLAATRRQGIIVWQLCRKISVSGGLCALWYMCREVSVPWSSVPGGVCAVKDLCWEVYVPVGICAVICQCLEVSVSWVSVPGGICAVGICARSNLGLPTQLLEDFNYGIIHKSSSKCCFLRTTPGRCCANSE